MDQNWTRDEVKAQLAELVRLAVPSESATFDLYWELVSPQLEAILEQGIELKKGPRGWQLGQAQLFGSVEGDLVGNLMLATIGSWAEARKSGVADKESISNIVSGYTKSNREITQFQKGIEDFVLDQMSQSKGTAPVPALSRSADMVEVFTLGVPKRVMSRADADSWVKQHGLFEMVMDEDKRKFLIDGRSVNLPPIEWRLLSYVLSNMGRELHNRDAARHAWDDEEVYDFYRARSLDQAYSRLRNKLGDSISRRIITNRGSESRTIEPGIRYCLIRPISQPKL